ncbi:MAG: fibronectin type III domain-containing protein [Eubacterium sp.]
MKRNLFAFVLTFIMAFSGVCAVEAIVGDSVIVAEAAALSAPSVTVKSASYNSATVSWKKISAAKKYIVYRSTKKSSGYKAVKTITKNSTVTYTDKSLTCGTTYYYKVKAVNGSKSKLSTAKSVKIVPATSSSLSVSSSTCGKITIKYSKVSGATGYQIYYSATKNGTYKKIASTKSTSYTYSIGLGKKGYFKVRAYRTVNKKNVYGAFTAAKSCTAKSHTYGSYRISVQPTCVKSGQKYKVCQTCGQKSYATMEPTYEHKYGTYKLTKAATCTTDGVMTSTCADCGKARTKSVKATGHTLVTTTVEATCTEAGSITTSCKNCSYSTVTAVAALDHDYVKKVVEPTCTDDGYDLYTCSRCGDSYQDNPTPAIGGNHKYEERVYEPTCKTDGYTCQECIYCHNQIIDENSYVTTPYTEHIREGEYTVKEDGFRYYTCPRCGNDFKEKTCYIDLSRLGDGDYASFADTAVYDAESGKLTLTGKADVDAFEITGSATDLTIVVNAEVDTEVKLNNAEIINGKTATDETGASASQDCIKFYSTSTTMKQAKDDAGNLLFDDNDNPVMELDTAEVSLSAKDGTTNTLKVTEKGGNAIESHTKLELKGHGILNIDTVSTSIDSKAKLIIKNLTLNINSQNRGIDTKEDVPLLDANGNLQYINGVLVTEEEYYNIEFGANANVTINSTDDCIRGKNIDFDALDTALGEVDTVLNITSVSGDGIQAEGSGKNRKVVLINSGIITINAGKYAFNCSEDLVEINVETVSAFGTAGIYKG